MSTKKKPESPGAMSTSVVVITANRPALLRRSLQSIFARPGPHSSVTVVDGSGASEAPASRLIVEEFRDTGRPVRYFGSDEAAEAENHIERHGFRLSDFGPYRQPGVAGVSRTMALLLTAGERLVMLDDDILYRPWSLPEAQLSVELGGHRDARQWEFYRTRSEALSGLAAPAADVLALHSLVLSESPRSLVALSGECARVADACPHIMSLTTASSPAPPRVSVSGIAGDSARDCPYHLLLMEGFAGESLRSADCEALVGLSYREVRRIARRIHFSHQWSECTTYCIGIDNSRPTPPFMPVQQHEDVVFGAMLGFLEPDAYLAHLPVGIVHDSGRPPSYGDEALDVVRRTTIGELFLCLTSELAKGARPGGPGERWRHLANGLTGFAKLDVAQAEQVMVQMGLRRRCETLQRLEKVARSSTSPIVNEACALYRRVLQQHANNVSFFLPIEFSAASCRETVALVQERVQLSGALLASWPAIWGVMRDHPFPLS